MAGRSRGGRLAERYRVELVCFPLVAAVYALLLFGWGYNTFYYDSALYWQLGHSFEHDGHFSRVAFRRVSPKPSEGGKPDTTYDSDPLHTRSTCADRHT